MGQTLVTAIATLLALVVGVLIEPVKNAFSHKARARQVRAERCEEFIAAASAHFGLKKIAVMKVSGVFRPVFPFDDGESVRREIDILTPSAEKMRSLVAVLHLYGPNELGHAAMGLSMVAEGSSDWDLKDGQMTEKDLATLLNDHDKRFSMCLDAFVRVARKHISE